MKRLLLAPLALLGVGAATYVPWEDLTEADRLFAVATRFTQIDGRRVHYPTPTAELATALAALPEAAAHRHLAEARRELGDLPGALQALEQWAETEGAEAWAEAARWGAAQGQIAFAFRAADRAVAGLGPEARRELLDDEVKWADAHPEAADPLALRRARAEAFPEDGPAAEDWVRALEKTDRIDEAQAALQATRALDRETRLLLRADLLAAHAQDRRAFEVLDEALAQEPITSVEVRQAYAQRTDKGHPAGPSAWRAALERGFDAAALLRLVTYFEGQGRGDAAADLLRQVERRYESRFDRTAWLLVARLEGEIDAVPEAFRARLGASAKATSAEQADDLAMLARLALRAGGRPLAWGTYADEPYRWVARIDRTPGFWTGGVSFLMTGQDWKDALAHLESEALPERTFATARALVDELARRVPAHAELPSLRAAMMARHVERGEGREALALLPLLEKTAAADEARRLALLALRSSEAPLPDELRLWRERLRTLAADASRPSLEPPVETGERRIASAPPPERYKDVLDEALARLDQRDHSHRAALDLVLQEMDRLPDAEALWEFLAGRLESWNLDDELGPRFERALARFPGEGFWARAARWYARRQRSQELQRLADELVARFSAAGIFARAAHDSSVRLAVDSQPRVGTRVRLVAWADWVRLRALERFPQSPAVFAEARAHLLRRSEWTSNLARYDRESPQRVVVEDALMDERAWALLFADPKRREELFAEAVRTRTLERRLAEWERAPEHTPVHDRLLMEGWARLSRFERAAGPARRLAAAYPGDGALASSALSLLRSLASLRPEEAAPAAALVARTAPALADPNPLWTALGEMEEDRGRSAAAQEAWRHLLDREPRSPEKVNELATVLWDYGHGQEALAVIEDARQRLARPSLLAFEAGVLREDAKDLDGAVREYLAAGTPEDQDCFCSSFESDQRSLRRLTQLLGRDRPRADVKKRIASFRAGERADERALVSLLPLAGILMPDANYDWTADDWIDEMDLPRDPVGRDARAAARADWRPLARTGMAQIAADLRAKALQMIPRATESAFLDALEPWRDKLHEGAPDRTAETDWKDALLARQAELAATPEERVAREVDRARFLATNGRAGQADAVWTALAPRLQSLPEGAPRLRAEAERAGFVERSRGPDAAALEWARLTTRYPWSLGLLEDRLAFLLRVGRGDEERQVLEAVAPKAGDGHRDALLERLTREALEAQDLAQARRAVTRLLAEPRLDASRRLAAIHLVGRLSFREDPAFDALARAAAEAPKIEAERRADVYAEMARAAHQEKQDKAAMALWIEALNRRLERSWLREAGFAAAQAGEAAAFRSFFEKQRERSPRDVRWAVAVREVRLLAGDTEGAIEMARAAISVRPERESLWREAVELLRRAGRAREAAALLAEWQKPRPADEGAAGWRADVLAGLGAGDEGASVERAALAAYAKEAPLDEDRTRELAARRGRAARRLHDRGFPAEAWGLLAEGGDLSRVAKAQLGGASEAELALAAGRYLAYLRFRADDDEFRTAAARVLAERGRPEQRDEVLAFLGVTLYPAAGPQAAAFDRWWPFAVKAEMDGALRVVIARRVLAATPGPWSTATPAAFEEAVGEAAVGHAWPVKGMTPLPVPLPALWVRDLVRRDDADALWSFLEPRMQALFAQVRADTPLAPNVARLEWAAWLDDSAALALWARAAANRPERLAELASVLSDRRRWNRFWALAAQDRWDVGVLVARLPDDARTAWFSIWQSPSPHDADPVRRARAETIARVSQALARLVTGAPGAEADPLFAKLRGPRTVGDVLGRDPRWTWPEFAPRRDAAGQVLEQGDDRIVGRGAEEGRIPAALWGERPGMAWYVLASLLRLREKDADAALVPLDVPERGAERTRGRLAAALAESVGDEENALALSPDLAPRLRLLVKRGETEKARALLQDETRGQQAALTEAGYRVLARQAADLGLPDPVELLDPKMPVTGALLAYIADARGLAVARRLSPRDAVDFRSALVTRWLARPLSRDEARFALEELWPANAIPLPDPALRALGGIWPHTAAWLTRLRPDERMAGLAALFALPDSAKLEALWAGRSEPEDDGVRLLRLRVHLLRGEDERALAVLEGVLREIDHGEAIRFAPAPLVEPADEETGEAASVEAAGDPQIARLRSFFAAFKEASRAELVAAKIRAALRAQREPGPATADTWAFALELSPAGEERSALLAELERAYLRGDLSGQLWPVVNAMARVVPADLPRWLGRVDRGFGFDAVAARARALRIAGDREAAARVLVEARRAAVWNAAEEVRAFDLWRAAVPLPKAGAKDTAPAAWAAARVFWSEKAESVGPDLAAHLRDHPFDLRAARAALRTVAPADEDMLRLAVATLRLPTMHLIGTPFPDQILLRLRAARALRARSAVAARIALGTVEPRALWTDLRARRFPAAEMRAALADLARLEASGGRGDAALAMLEDVDGASALKLRAEMRELPRTPPPPYRLESGHPAPWRPRDLDWTTLASALGVATGMEAAR